ncbi:USP6 N-terminal-like protein [Silurus asotus]|uniref:USP6 N-terminal-like protein n=1 Tax=Silurus asotus TaxID=30991 RepID=A0AAD5AG69_SILAS|nr:USP6 N-terminal-like protein [Silurus asotus]
MLRKRRSSSRGKAPARGRSSTRSNNIITPAEGRRRSINTPPRSSSRTRSVNTPPRSSSRTGSVNTQFRSRSRSVNTPPRSSSRSVNTPPRSSSRSRSVNTPPSSRSRCVNTPPRSSSRSVNTPPSSSSVNTAVRSRRSSGKAPVRGRSSSVNTTVRGRSSSGKAPVRGRSSSVNTTVRGRSSSGKAPVRGRSSSGKAPVRGKSSIGKAPVSGRSSIGKAPVRGRSSIGKAPVWGRSSMGKAPVRGGRGRSNVGFDEFGFSYIKRRERTLQHRSHDYSYPQPNPIKVKELCELLSYWNGSSFICRSQIERFIRIGIPPALRCRVWKCLLDIEKVRDASSFNYQVCLREIRKPLVDLSVSEYSIISAISTLGERENEFGSAAAESLGVDVALFRQIALDLQRSFPTHRSLMGDSPEAIEGQAKLFRVLTAYASYNPQIGYSQGMSYIAAVLLMLLGEEDAFWALVVLLEKPKYLSELFDSSLKKIQHQALVFQQLLKHRKPQVYQHLENLGVSSVHFIMQWFLTLFTSLPCWDSVLAIWDLFLLHGMVVVFRAGLTVLQLLESRLMSMSEEAAVLPVLLHVPIDVSQYRVLIPALWSTEVQEWEITCMNRLILEETDEGHDAEERSRNSPRSLSRVDQTEHRAKVEKNEAPGKEAVGTGGRNVFARMLKAAHRYLADVSKQSVTKISDSPPEAEFGSRGSSSSQTQRRPVHPDWNEASAEHQESPCRILSPGRAPLTEIIIGSSSSIQIRESQLI